MADFLSKLNESGVLIADGATGTMLHRLGLPHGTPPERWNLENPEGVRQLYQSYLDAGSDILLTNTFGGSRIRLEMDGLGERVHEINLAAARLARQIAGQNAFVFGDIGPTGQLIKPYGPLEFEAARAAFAEQAAALAEGGVDAILVETMSDVNEAKAAVQGAKQASHLPVLVTFSFDTRGRTMMGLKPAEAGRQIWDEGVTAVGANCGRTLTETLEAIRQMRTAVPEAVLIAKPNAGLPHAEGGDAVYDVTPEIMAEYAEKFTEQGVKIFGGCCGSTPDHIKAVVAALK